MNILCIISNFKNLLRFVLWLSIWFVLVNKQCAIEMNVYSVFAVRVLYKCLLVYTFVQVFYFLVDLLIVLLLKMRSNSPSIIESCIPPFYQFLFYICWDFVQCIHVCNGYILLIG